MTRQNRVQPNGAIIAHPARGLFMGNRGILHREGQLVARWRHPHWITCVLSFKGRRRALMQPGAYTELFFLDEAVACAAGHRPCAECRRADYTAFRTAFVAAQGGTGRAGEIDRMLHISRVEGRQQRRFAARVTDLPEGAFVHWQDRPHLVTARGLLPYTPDSYLAPVPPPHEAVQVLTPAVMVTVLRQGWRPVLHPSAYEENS